MIPIITALTAGFSLLLFLILYATYKPHSHYRKGMLFAVTLPEHVKDDSRIKAIQARYKRNSRRTFGGFLLSLAPFFILRNWEAYQVIYLLVLIFATIIIVAIPFRRAFRETLALKRENDWFVGAKRVVQSDLRVARLKNQKSAPTWSYLIPIGMAAGFALWIAFRDPEFLLVPLVGVGITLLCFFTELSHRRSKAKVYSENSEVNLSLNQAKRRIQSYTWLWVAVAENLHMWLLYLLVASENAEMFGVWLTAMILFSLLPVGAIVYSSRKFNALEQELLKADGKVIYTDDDEYWANGFTYHNPNDKSLFVTKRVGIGETINTGTLAGKIIMGGVALIAAGVVLGVSVLLVISETVSPSLTLTADQRIEIDYPMYSYEFAVSEIEQLSLVDDIPSGRKSNGEATSKVARGNFRLKDWGKTRLYVYKKSPPFIQMKLKDQYVVFGDEDPQVTKRIYEQIKQEWSKPRE